MDEKILEKCKEIAQNGLKTGNCVGYKVFTAKGDDLLCGHTACYAGICTNGEPGCIVINKLQVDAYKGMMDNPKPYLHWLINDSAFAESFISKDADQVLQEGLVVNTCDVNGSLLVGGMTALRGMWENNMANNSYYHFNKLVKAGCTEDFAFIMCHGIGVGGDFSPHTYGGHSAINFSGLTVGQVKNFITHNPQEKAEFYKTNSYIGVHALWRGGYAGKSFGDWLSDRLLKDTTQETASLNPFEDVPHRRAVYPNGAELFKKLADLCEVFYARHINEKEKVA